MKKLLALLLALAMVLSFAACSNNDDVQEPDNGDDSNPEEQQPSVTTYYVERDDWADDVKAAINDFMDLYGHASENYNENSYVVFDFDNTSSIFDIEEQLAIYQLQVMAFAFTPDEITDILLTEVGDHDEDRTELGYGNGSYNDWAADITAAYTYLYEEYGPFSAAGLDEEAQAEIHADEQWLEFATKIRAMYDLVYDAESASVAYPWVLYWFTGMTQQEVYDLAYASHTYYGALETSTETWTSPDIDSKVGVVEYTWNSGTGVSENIKELWKTLDANGIDVWVCSASAVEPVRAAIDAFGLHDYCTGMVAMTRVLDEDGKFVNEYDYETGYAWFATEDGWEEATENPTKAQTQGVGKVVSIQNALWPIYNCGPLAGFMDSTGDYNFCTEFASLKLVINFNRASRKVTDGGGVIAELAIYQRDTLGYDLATANEAGDTLYVLQGREENGHRGFRNSNLTMTYGATEEKLFKNEDNQTQLQYMIDNEMTTEEIINTFAMKTAADDENNVLGIKYGFLKEYAGYHNIK